MSSPPPRDGALEALLDERDHLNVQISLAMDTDRPDFGKIQLLRRRLEHVENVIPRHTSDPG